MRCGLLAIWTIDPCEDTPMETHKAANSRLKRLVDVGGAAIALVLLGPLMIVIAACIKLNLGSPVFFVQIRPGLHGRTFPMLKFRSMRNVHNRYGQPLSDELRMTRVGCILRRFSLDELPELFNVLKGQMSLVGPRPLLVEYLARYTSEQARRHLVKPGITGWAQVNGRNAIDWESKFVLDVWYLDHWSIWLDLRILWMTVLKVLRREGISAEGHISSPEFLGSSDPGGASQ